MSDRIPESLNHYYLNNKDAYFAEAFSRNIGLLTLQEQETLKNARVAIPGMGGVGGAHLIAMVRSGVGNFNIADFDVFEPVNVNRQYGATLPGFGRPKTEVMKKQALSINPFLRLNVFREGITHDNVDMFLNGVDVVLDGLDFFNFDIRRLVFNKAREKGIFVVTAGPLGFSTALLVFSPYAGMSFDDYFNIVDNMAPEDQYLAFAMGLAPRPTHFHYIDLKKVSLKYKQGPSLDVACLGCASIAGSKAIQIILNKGKIKPAPHYIQFDPYMMKLRKGKLLFGNKNPIQRVKTQVCKYLLKRNARTQKTRMPRIPNVASDTGTLSDDIIDFLINSGTQAPSGDNAQPWKFEKSTNSIAVYLDKCADQSFFNINQIASIISCGAVVENIKIAASNFGIKTHIHNPSNNPKGNLMAKLDFSLTKEDNALHKDVLFDSIWARSTNRHFYQRKPVTPHILDSMKSALSDFPEVDVHIVSEARKRKEIAKIIMAVDQIRTQNKSLHEHLHRMIRYSSQEATAKGDGLPLKNLEAGIAGELFLKFTRPWNIMNILNRSGISKLVAFHSYKGVVRSSGIALLTVHNTDWESFLSGGRALERAWLTLTRFGVSVQPMTAITLFWLRWLLKGKDQFPLDQQKILESVWEKFQELFPEIDWNTHGPVMLFRYGYAKPPTTGTLRKDIGDLMLTD